MSKSKEKETKSDSSESKSRKTKKKTDHKIEFNLDDGVTWHDFVGIFVLIGQFILRILRLILSPIFWVYGENVRMIRFMRAAGHQRVLSDDERWFVETIPFVYTVTGIVGGILVGLFAALSFSNTIEEFLKNLNLEFIATLFNFIGGIFVFIYNILKSIVLGIATFIHWIIDLIIGAFSVSPYLAFGGLVIVGLVIMLTYVAITETGALEGVSKAIKKAFFWLIGSPERFRMRVNSIYRRINHNLTIILVGKERLHTRTQVYFKKVVIYTFILSIWSFVSGIVIGTNPSNYGNLKTTFEKVAFTSSVLFVAGVISGTLFFAFMARFLDLFNRKKYIAPQFIKEGDIDENALTKKMEDDEERINEELKVPDVIPKKENKPEKKKESAKESN